MILDERTAVPRKANGLRKLLLLLLLLALGDIRRACTPLHGLRVRAASVGDVFASASV